MLRNRNARALRWVALGVGLGLLVGLGMTVGTVIGMRAAGWSNPPQSAQAAFEEVRLRASGSHGAETLAMATGPIDSDGEGVFFLDFLTGDLQCFVLNPRVGKFTGWFKTNVVKELPVEKGKKPAYVMTTGAWNPRGGTGNQPASCVVYVADSNTGIFAAYSFVWQRNAAAQLATQAAPMVTLDGGKARTLELRE